MSHENMELARQCYEAVDRRDFDALLSACDPAVEFEPPERAPYAGTYRGVDAVRGLIQSLSEVWDLRWELERFFESGDRLVVFVAISVRGKASDAPAATRVGHLWEMRNGKVLRFKVFPEREKALKAAGLSEQDAHADS